jgi:hypothetical protein
MIENLPDESHPEFKEACLIAQDTCAVGYVGKRNFVSSSA